MTKRIVEHIETHGTLPWTRPWSSIPPQNAITARPYRGINRIILSMTEFTDPRWLTFRSIAELGGRVAKGSKGTSVAFWHFEDDDSTSKKRAWMRSYTVFNVEQTEGLDLPALPLRQVPNPEPLQVLAELLQGWEDRPDCCRSSDGAYYVPATDTVWLPPSHDFKSSEMFVSVALHEYVHATGAAHRLARPGVLRVERGSTKYAEEELVAQLGSEFLMQEMGLDGAFDASCRYVSQWASVLVNSLKADSRMIFRAASAAQKAALWISGRTEAETAETEPAHEKLAVA